MFVYVMVAFPKAIMEDGCAKHLTKMFGCNKLSTFVNVMMLNQFELKNWLNLNAELNIARVESILGVR